MLSFLGPSWKTSLAGWTLIISGALGLIADIVVTQGIPKTLVEWLLFGSMLVGGIGKLVSKDSDVSNAPKPVAPIVVSATDASKPNPSEVKETP